MGCETTEMSNSACRYPYDTVSIQCGKQAVHVHVHT